MNGANGNAEGAVDVRVELFGLAAIAGGRRAVPLSLPADASMTEVAAALAKACPAVVGEAVREDGQGFRSSYVLSVNGRSFVDGGRLTLRPGDSLLLFSGQAGG